MRPPVAPNDDPRPGRHESVQFMEGDQIRPPSMMAAFDLHPGPEPLTAILQTNGDFPKVQRAKCNKQSMFQECCISGYEAQMMPEHSVNEYRYLSTLADYTRKAPNVAMTKPPKPAIAARPLMKTWG